MNDVLTATIEPKLATGQTRHVSKIEFDEWLWKAAPNDQLVYAIGDLAYALHFGGSAHAHLHELQEAAMVASDNALVCLTQRRIQYYSESLKRSAVFEYVATKRKGVPSKSRHVR